MSGLDDLFEEVAAKNRADAEREDADPVLQAKRKEKAEREQAAMDAGRTVYTAEERARSQGWSPGIMSAREFLGLEEDDE